MVEILEDLARRHSRRMECPCTTVFQLFYSGHLMAKQTFDFKRCRDIIQNLCCVQSRFPMLMYSQESDHMRLSYDHACAHDT